MSEVVLNNVGKIYQGNIRAVKDASLTIADGEFIVLVGPSGCGKSTILRMIAGLEVISEGEISINGRVVNALEPGERDIAMVFQNYALYPHMSVYKNMAYGLKNSGIAKDEIDQRISKAAKTLQLEEYLERKPSQLSGGQRQRVAMGRAIVREPQVFLFDEPLSNLDTKLRIHMRSELKSLHQELAATFVFVTHDQVEAMSLADRIVVMNNGQIEQIGTPMELYHKPATQFVAEFIGSPPMNVIDLDGEAGKALAQLCERVPADVAKIGIRPESLFQATPRNPGIEVDIAMREVLGSETLVHVVLPGGDKATMRLPSKKAEKATDKLSLAIKQQEISWFDSDGKRAT